MENIKDGFANLRDKWQAQSKNKKAAWLGGILSIIFIIIMAFYLTTRVQYGVLFSNLSAADAGKVTEQLQTDKVAYKLADNGTTVLADKTKIPQERIDLAMDNKLPNTSTGYELFDDTSMMTTDADRKVMYQRATAGELERSIETLDAVQSAKVMLVMPTESVFADNNDDTKKASASIVLTLNGNTIDDSAVQAIVDLTAGAVENLSTDNIKVVDSKGQVLYDGNSNADDSSQISGASSKYLSIKKQYESMMEQKIQNLLTPVYGAGKFEVAVNLDLNFNAIERKQTKYSNPQIRSENLQRSGTNANGTTKNTQTGQANNNASNVTGNNSDDSNASYSHTINNELNTDTIKTISAPGSINRMTTSVILNNGALSNTDQTKIQAIISSAVGYNRQRGDVIQVSGLNFANQGINTANTTKKKTTNWLLYAIIGAIILLIIAIIIFIIIRRRRAAAYADYEDDYEDDYAQTNETPRPTTAPTSASNESQEPAVATQETSKTEKAKQYADDNPQVVAELLKAWVKEK